MSESNTDLVLHWRSHPSLLLPPFSAASLACFLQWGPVGLSLEEFSQMRAVGEGIISCFMNNAFLGIIACVGFSQGPLPQKVHHGI